MDPIKHVVVLMLENHSFDQMLGFMGLINPDINGVDPTRYNVNPTDNSKVYQVPCTTMTEQNDPGHEFTDAIEQAKDDNGHFVSNYLKNYPGATKDQIQEIMGYYPEGSLPVLHELAKNFMICDNWFASLPGLTWPNRIFAHTGTSLGHIDMPDSLSNLDLYTYDQTTIFDLLSEAKVPWRIYCNGPAQTLVLEHQRNHIFHYVTMDAFEGDCARNEKHFPGYVFIEPTYGGVYQNDQHPPSNLMNGDALLGQVYNAIRKNKKLWESTLLVVLYDECGGFYDHVTPETTVAPDGHTENFNFQTLGFRVPALLIGANIAAGVDHTLYDHTSLLKYLCEKFQLDPNRLGARTPQANSFWNLVSSDEAEPSPKSIVAAASVPNTEYSTEETEVIKEYIVANSTGEAGEQVLKLFNIEQKNTP